MGSKGDPQGGSRGSAFVQFETCPAQLNSAKGTTGAEAGYGLVMAVRARLLWALAGFAFGFVVSAVVVGLVAAAGGYELVLVPEIGSALGRTTMQLARGVELVRDRVPIPLGWLVFLQAPLWVGLIGAPVLARRSGLDWKSQMGWSMRPRDVGIGIGAGIGLQFVLVPLLYLLIMRLFGDLDVGGPARSLVDQAGGILDVVALTLMTIIGAPIVEEVFYRGLLQGALHDWLGPIAGIGCASLLFAASHFQGVQFPALVLVGVVNGILVWRTGRLGPAIWSHATFNSATVVVLLTT